MYLKKNKNIIIKTGILFLIIFAAFIIRNIFIDFKSIDYNVFLSVWYDFIKNKGGFNALKHNFSDYTPPYLYLLTFGTYLNINKLHYIKYLTFIFEIVAALFVMLIVNKRYNNYKVACAAFGCTLFIPTVICNGAIWAQCDIIFTSFILGSIYFIMCNKPIKSLIFYGIALSFKLQAVFILPLFGVLLFKNRVKFQHLFIIPLTYIIFIIPNALLGRPLKELLLVYMNQSREYQALTMNAPNIYQWYNENLTLPHIEKLGVLLTLIVVLAIFYLSIKYIKVLTDEAIVELTLIFAIVVPFLLPHMHERYFFIADVFALVYAFYFPRYWCLGVIVPCVSFFSYYPYLLGGTPVPLRILALIMLLSGIIVVYNLSAGIYSDAVKTGKTN
ncbi:MAG: hypothetical protein ABRQ25_13850 [Clostridiaceae bacterium]